MTELGDRFDDRLRLAVRDPIPSITPPPSLEARILEAIAGESPAPAPAPGVRTTLVRRKLRLPRLVPALAGAAALVLAAVVASTSLDGGPAGVLEIDAVLEAPSGPAAASVEVRRTGIGRIVAFESDSLPILPKGDYYELWFVAPGDTPERPDRISAGTFHPDEDGRSVVRFAAAVDPSLYPGLSVTAEPGDGDPRPTGPEVLRSP